MPTRKRKRDSSPEPVCLKRSIDQIYNEVFEPQKRFKTLDPFEELNKQYKILTPTIDPNNIFQLDIAHQQQPNNLLIQALKYRLMVKSVIKQYNRLLIQHSTT